MRLKWGIEYTGKLLSYDKYFNLQLANSEEYVEGNCRGSLGEILIRCNNVLYVREMPEELDYWINKCSKYSKFSSYSNEFKIIN